jgi:hypothetical protein
MSEPRSPDGPAATDHLDAQLATFLTALTKAGYAQKTQRDKERLTVPFIRWCGMRGLRIPTEGDHPFRRQGDHRFRSKTTTHSSLKATAFRPEVGRVVAILPEWRSPSLGRAVAFDRNPDREGR